MKGLIFKSGLYGLRIVKVMQSKCKKQNKTNTLISIEKQQHEAFIVLKEPQGKSQLLRVMGPREKKAIWGPEEGPWAVPSFNY